MDPRFPLRSSVRLGWLRVAALCFLVLAPPAAHATPVGPSLYQCFDATQTTAYQGAFTGTCAVESPFAATVRTAGFGYFVLENFEDQSFDAPGVTPVLGILGGIQYAVDADDGAIDGIGGVRGSHVSGNLTLAFDVGVLGLLPTHVGIVVTAMPNALNGDIVLEAFGPGGSLGTTSPVTIAGSPVRNTANDTFFGWTDAGGISSITLSNTNTVMVVDHLQYGGPIPEPSSWVMLLAGLALTVVGRRRTGVM